MSVISEFERRELEKQLDIKAKELNDLWNNGASKKTLFNKGKEISEIKDKLGR